MLRVDAQGSNFSFSINDQLVGQVTDADYATGEVGLFVQTFDAANAHVHFDELTIRNFEGVQPQASDQSVLYQDDFTNPASGWPEAKFDNYFIGYHEPEFYHVEVTSPNYKTTVFEPEKKTFGDVTIEVKAFTASAKTAETGDFSFGLVFRRSGDQYYAFAISQRTKKWYVLKSAPNALTIWHKAPMKTSMLRMWGMCCAWMPRVPTFPSASTISSSARSQMRIMPPEK